MALRLALSVLVLSSALLVQGLSDQLYESEFTAWMAKHQKSYSVSEFATRLAAFKSNYDFIQTHNAGQHSFKVGLNAVSDLTVEEFTAQYLTLKPPTFFGKYVTPVPQPGTSTRQVEAEADEAPARQHVARTTTTLPPTTAAPTTKPATTKPLTTAAPTTKPLTTAAPTTKPLTTAAPTTKPLTTAAPTTKAPTTAPSSTTLDWQVKGAVTAIKDQQQCGCCWAFAATAAIEAINQINGAPLTNFSNQQVLDCTGTDSYGYASTCNGGYFDDAMNVVRQTGIQAMTTYAAYSGAQNANCQYNPSLKAGSVRNVSYPLMDSEAGLAAQLQIQPIAVSFDASGQAFQNYLSGVYTSTTCRSTSTNHAMLLIGYGVDSTTGAQYWRIKNQWGTYWGENGYIRVARGSNMCGVASYSAYPTLVVPPTTMNVFVNSFQNGWSLSTIGSVSSINQASTTAGQGTSVSAVVAPSGVMVLSLPQGSLLYSNFYYSIQASVASQVEIVVYYDGGAYSWTWFNMNANSWYSYSLDLSGQQSISQIMFNNTGTSTSTWYLNNLYFK